MRAVVLGAGNGSRLRSATGDVPKPLALLRGRPIIAHVLDALHSGGVDDVLVVTGYESEQVERVVDEVRPGGMSVRTVRNAEWASGNASSLWTARSAVQGQGFVLAMADHLVDPAIVRALADGDLFRLAVERTDPTDIRGAEATRARVQDGKVVDLGKTIDDWNALDTGLFWCSPRIFDAMTPALRDGEAGQIFATLARAGELDAVDVSGRLWIDIDTVEDLRRAEDLLESQHGRFA